MEESVKKCYELVINSKKLSYKELNYLLHNKNNENKNSFIEGFLNVIFNITYKVYSIYETSFSDDYNFEDFFYDSIEYAIKIYNSWICKSNDYDNLLAFVNYFRLEVLLSLPKTNISKMGFKLWKKVNKLLEIREDFFNKNGYYPRSEELIKISSYRKYVINSLVISENIDNLIMEDNNIDDFIDKEFYKEALEDILSIISMLDNDSKNMLYEIYGFTNKRTITDIANERNVSRQRIFQIKNQLINEIKENELIKKKYYL